MEFIRRKLATLIAMPDVDIERLRMEAQAAQAQKRYRKALALYARLADVCPDDPLAQLRYGEMLMRIGRGREAIMALEVAATRYTERREEAKAFAVWRMVLELSPGHPKARELLAARC